MEEEILQKRSRELSDYITLFTNYLKSMNYSSNTLKNYLIDIKYFCSFLESEDTELSRIDRNCLREYLIDLGGRGYSGSSVARKFSSVKSFVRFLLKEKVISRNPLTLLQVPKYPKRLPQFFYLKELRHLFDQFDLSSPRELRDRAIVELLYVSGMRVGELVSIGLGDIDFNKGELKIRGKGNKERIVFIGDKTLSILKRYSIVRAYFTKPDNIDEDNLFIRKDGKGLTSQNVWYVVKRLDNKLKLKRNLYPHALRHSFATHLLDSGADIRSVQELLGHKDLSSTQVYTHISKERLKEVYMFAHPRGRAK